MAYNLCPAGRQALLCFSLSALVFTISFFSTTVLGFSSELWALTYWGPALYFCLFNFILRYCFRGFIYEVSIRATFLGSCFATGLYLATLDSGWRVFGLYFMVLSMFHFSEFMAVAITNPRTLTIDSFILNHSVQYAVAAVASWLEWGVENYFFPGMKTYFWLSYVGVTMCIAGELLRKTAMCTAKTNFNHTVQFVKQRDHELVTHGVYSMCRHPSYVGWFYWSVGTQITLLNPFCLVMYTLASWTFFRERIYAEELTLLSFFGPQYVKYQKEVATGLPFIKGYVPDNTAQKAEDVDKLNDLIKGPFYVAMTQYEIRLLEVCYDKSPQDAGDLTVLWHEKKTPGKSGTSLKGEGCNNPDENTSSKLVVEASEERVIENLPLVLKDEEQYEIVEIWDVPQSNVALGTDHVPHPDI